MWERTLRIHDHSLNMPDESDLTAECNRHNVSAPGPDGIPSPVTGRMTETVIANPRLSEKFDAYIKNRIGEDWLCEACWLEFSPFGTPEGGTCGICDRTTCGKCADWDLIEGDSEYPMLCCPECKDKYYKNGTPRCRAGGPRPIKHPWSFKFPPTGEGHIKIWSEMDSTFLSAVLTVWRLRNGVRLILPGSGRELLTEYFLNLLPSPLGKVPV